MIRENIKTLAELYRYSSETYSNKPFTRWSDTDEGGYTYSSFGNTCEDLSRLLSEYGIGAGSKVAIFSQSMPNWSVAFFSAVAFGRIAIPILPDSSGNEVKNIINHSGSRVLFVSQRLSDKISEEVRAKMTLIIEIDTLRIIKSGDKGVSGELSIPSGNDIATIIYTSGTTGNAKGVMLSHGNLSSNVITSWHTCKRYVSDRWLSLLPMAHTLEKTLGMLYPMFCGASIFYLQKAPVPAVLLNAMQTVKPTTILSVPLIIEKIYRGSVLPTIKKSPILRWLDKNANFLMCRIIGYKLKKTFGGKLSFFGIGGAKLDSEVERFLKKSGFPYAIGYGLTETSPLAGFSFGKDNLIGSFGRPVHNVKIKLIDVNPETGEGEIAIKGPNVMLGYYKDPERTKNVFTEDGWFKTNDLAILDKSGNFVIKGRKSNMILGASGENIYPEEIESVINNLDGVTESIVIERHGRLVALVQPIEGFIDWDKELEDKVLDKVRAWKEKLLKVVNGNVNKTSQVSSIEIMKVPFEKTATMKIRRFLYKENAPTLEQDLFRKSA